jgi:hypothetical protein
MSGAAVHGSPRRRPARTSLTSWKNHHTVVSAGNVPPRFREKVLRRMQRSNGKWCASVAEAQKKEQTAPGIKRFRLHRGAQADI